MKMTLDIPSVAVGFLVAIPLAPAVRSAIDAAVTATDGFPSHLSAGLLAAGAVLAFAAGKPFGEASQPNLIGRLRKAFTGRYAAAQALAADKVGTPPAQTPFEWLKTNGIAARRHGSQTDLKRAIRHAMEKALEQDHAPCLVEALCFAFHVAARSDGETRKWLFVEMASRFNAADTPPAVFAAFVAEARKRYATYAALYDADQTGLGELHAFPATRAMALLAGARGRTVISCGEFLWLKALDRPLWYALNNLGRKAFHVEGAAAVSHYMAERAARRAFYVPHVTGAVEGVFGYLHEMGIDPDNMLNRPMGEGEASPDAGDFDKDHSDTH